MKKVITIVMCLMMLTGCGSSESTTQTTASTTQSTTEEAKANKNDAFIDSLADGSADFPIIKSLDIIESDDTKIIDVKTDNGTNYVTMCEVLTSTLQEADYYKEYELWLRYVNGDKHIEWYPEAPDYKKGMLTSSASNPVYDVTLDDIKEALSE